MWNEISKKISYHAVYDHSIIEALHYAKENGFAGIQIAIESPHLSFENLLNNHCEKIRDFCEKQDLSINIHGPDVVISLFTHNSHLKQGIFSYYNQLFTFAEKIKSRLITIHLGDYTTFPTDTDPTIEIPDRDLEIYEETLQNNLETLLRFANNRFIICIENYNIKPFILDILHSFLKQEEIWLCWDLPKTYNRKNQKDQSIENFFIKNINSVKQVHLHDLNDYGESHKVLGSGVLDFKYFLNKLNISNILDFCIEVRPQEKACESLLNLRSLILAEGNSS